MVCLFLLSDYSDGEKTKVLFVVLFLTSLRIVCWVCVIRFRLFQHPDLLFIWGSIEHSVTVYWSSLSGDQSRCGRPAVRLHHKVSVCGSHGLQISPLAGETLPLLFSASHVILEWSDLSIININIDKSNKNKLCIVMYCCCVDSWDQVIRWPVSKVLRTNHVTNISTEKWVLCVK